jgi:hypothetical protein
LEENIKAITDESEKLKNTIVGKGGVVDAIEDELNAVKDVTSGYATLRQTLFNLTGDYEGLCNQIDETIRKAREAN